MNKVLLSLVAMLILFGCGDIESSKDTPDFTFPEEVTENFGKCHFDIDNVVLNYTDEPPATKTFYFDCNAMNLVVISIENDKDNLFLVNGEKAIVGGIVFIPVTLTFSLNPDIKDFSAVKYKTAKIVVQYYTSVWDIVTKEYTITAIP